MEWVLPLLAGLAIGSLLKSAADHLMSRRASVHDRWYQEKREAYLGLLAALHDAAVQPSDANSKAYALWQPRCDLFGSKDVSTWAQEMVNTSDRLGPERDAAFQNLIAAMRADLRAG